MSTEASTWVRENIPNNDSTLKAILMYLASYHNPYHGKTNPSLKRLEIDTGYDRTTIWRKLQIAEDEGWISVVRAGDRKTSNLYTINWDRVVIENPDYRAPKVGAQSNKGRCTEHLEVGAPCTPENQSRKPKERKRRAQAREVACSETPEGVSEEVWRQWEQHRKELRGSKWTPTARAMQLRELQTLRAAGKNLDECLRSAMASNWTACKAEYFKDRGGNAPTPVKERKLYGRGRDELFRQYINDQLPESISRVVAQAVPDVHALRMAAEREAWRMWNSEVWPRLLA